jgi:phage tail-like protein
VLLDHAHQDVLRWSFRDAFPCRWSVAPLRASSSTVAIEVLELAVEGIELVTP